MSYATLDRSLLWSWKTFWLIAPLVGLALVSNILAQRAEEFPGLLVILAALLLISGAAYVAFVLRLGSSFSSWKVLITLLLLGLAMRVSMFFSSPVQDDDYFRFLWEGGVTANGYSPYSRTPFAFQGIPLQSEPGELRQLAAEAKPVLQNINHPWLASIYPPISQAGFALAHLISPWSLNAWRLVLFLFDGLTLALLFLALKAMAKPLSWAGIYWLNPLLIKETYLSGHMEVLLFPCLAGLVILMIKRRHLLSSCALGLGVGVKIWPAILYPVLLAPLRHRPGCVTASLALFALFVLAMLLPMLWGGLGSDSGLSAYAATWEMNDALFLLVLWAGQALLWSVNAPLDIASVLARAVVAGLLIIYTLYMARSLGKDERLIPEALLMITAALFFLSPTQFPWYGLWILPFLTLSPRKPLLLLTPLLSLFYLRPALQDVGLSYVHDVGVVWVEFLPILVLLLLEHSGYRGRLIGPMKE